MDELTRLRETFDQSFAAPVVAAEETVRLLALRVNGDRFAVRIEELGGLHLDKRIVPLPGAEHGLLGMVGIRGRVVSVFSLAARLGYPPAGTPRWLVLSGGGEPVALAFAELDGYRQVLARALHQAADVAGHVRQVARLDDVVVPIISMAAIVASIRQRAGQPAIPKEQ